MLLNTALRSHRKKEKIRVNWRKFAAKSSHNLGKSLQNVVLGP